MKDLIDILKTADIPLPDEKMCADELLWWIIGYKACMDQVEFIVKLLEDQRNGKCSNIAKVTLADVANHTANGGTE